MLVDASSVSKEAESESMSAHASSGAEVSADPYKISIAS
jgi:hypothetical protein